MTDTSPARCQVSMAAEGWLVQPSSNCNRPLVRESEGECFDCGHEHETPWEESKNGHMFLGSLSCPVHGTPEPSPEHEVKP